MRFLKAVAIVAGVSALAGASAADAVGAPKWGGFYVGASAGLNGVSATETDTATIPPSVTTFSGGPSWGAVGSLTWGYDFRIAPGLLLGTYSSLDITNAEATLTSPGGDVNKLQQNWAYNSGVRLGALVNSNTLLYLDGGFSRAGFTFSYNPPAPGAPYTNGHVFDGWFAGLGAQEKITDALSVSLDYRFARYGSDQVGCGVGGVGCVVPIEIHEIQPDLQSVRIGLVYNVGGL